jgi:hypothetical protein
VVVAVNVNVHQGTRKDCSKPDGDGGLSSVNFGNLSCYLGELSPDERKAMEFTCEYGDLIEIEGLGGLLA